MASYICPCFPYLCQKKIHLSESYLELDYKEGIVRVKSRGEGFNGEITTKKVFVDKSVRGDEGSNNTDNDSNSLLRENFMSNEEVLDGVCPGTLLDNPLFLSKSESNLLLNDQKEKEIATSFMSKSESNLLLKNKKKKEIDTSFTAKAKSLPETLENSHGLKASVEKSLQKWHLNKELEPNLNNFSGKYLNKAEKETQTNETDTLHNKPFKKKNKWKLKHLFSKKKKGRHEMKKTKPITEEDLPRMVKVKDANKKSTRTFKGTISEKEVNERLEDWLQNSKISEGEVNERIENWLESSKILEDTRTTFSECALKEGLEHSERGSKMPEELESELLADEDDKSCKMNKGKMYNEQDSDEELDHESKILRIQEDQDDFDNQELNMQEDADSEKAKRMSSPSLGLPSWKNIAELSESDNKSEKEKSKARVTTKNGSSDTKKTKTESKIDKTKTYISMIKKRASKTFKKNDKQKQNQTEEVKEEAKQMENYQNEEVTNGRYKASYTSNPPQILHCNAEAEMIERTVSLRG